MPIALVLELDKAHKRVWRQEAKQRIPRVFVSRPEQLDLGEHAATQVVGARRAADTAAAQPSSAQPAE